MYLNILSITNSSIWHNVVYISSMFKTTLRLGLFAFCVSTNIQTYSILLIKHHFHTDWYNEANPVLKMFCSINHLIHCIVLEVELVKNHTAYISYILLD